MKKNLKSPIAVTLGLSLGLSLLASAPAVLAYDLPPINLGFTSFVDGGPPGGPGWYFNQFVQFYHATHFKDANGNDLPLPSPEINATVSLSQIVWLSNIDMLGGKFGATAVLPAVALETSYGAPGPFPETGKNGLGDFAFGPLIQWGPYMGPNGPRFVHRLEISGTIPTGEYDAKKTLNPGANHWTFNPYWSGTIFFTPQWTASTRIFYLWNGKNTDPNPGWVARGAKNVRPGQAFHFNFGTEYEVLPGKLRLGVNGYFLKQTTDTQMNGQDVANTRERAFGIGPGLLWHMTSKDHVFASYYKESGVRNRTSGDRLSLRYTHAF